MAKDAERQQWEYLTNSIRLADLQQLGEDGWELVALYDVPPICDGVRLVIKPPVIADTGA